MFKILFLFKSKSSFEIFYNFFISKVKNIFNKKKIVSFKRKHQSFISTKRITKDYFSSHAFNFLNYLKNLNSDFDYLEIGSYEGNSAIFVAKNFTKEKIYCVDNWEQTNEYADHKNYYNVKKNFDLNIKDYKNVYKIKISSDDFFLKNEKKFDTVYIDGYHHGAEIFKDCKNAWKYLKNNGYLICDDYIWNFYKNIKDNPCYAINQFLNEINAYFKVEKVSNSQIFIKKINS